MQKATFTLLTFLFLGFLPTVVSAQDALKPRPSPMAVATIKYEDTYVKVVYGRPHKKKREIFGELVPYGEVWRTGANEATEITLTNDVQLGGEKVDAGTYTLFTIPGKDKWTVILNSQLGQWGAYRHDPDYDVVKFDVPATSIDTEYEPFTIVFDEGAKKSNMNLIWDKTKVVVPIEFI